MAKDPAPHPISRPERMIAFMIAAIVGTSVLAFFVIIIATWMGAGDNGGFGEGVWPLIVMIPNVGLPIGFVLIVVLLVMSAVRRGRAAKDAS